MEDFWKFFAVFPFRGREQFPFLWVCPSFHIECCESYALGLQGLGHKTYSFYLLSWSLKPPHRKSDFLGSP